MRLSSQIIHFIRLNFADNTRQIGAVAEVAVMEFEVLIFGVCDLRRYDLHVPY